MRRRQNWIFMVRELKMKENKIIAISLIFVGLVLILWALSFLWSAIESKSWNTTEGRIESSFLLVKEPKIKSKTSIESTLYKEAIAYSYIVNGTRYLSNVVSSVDVFSSVQENHQQIKEKYPLNSTVTVYFDPTDPREARLEPGLVLGNLWTLLMGIAPLTVGIYLYRKKKD